MRIAGRAGGWRTVLCGTVVGLTGAVFCLRGSFSPRESGTPWLGSKTTPPPDLAQRWTTVLEEGRAAPSFAVYTFQLPFAPNAASGQGELRICRPSPTRFLGIYRGKHCSSTVAVRDTHFEWEYVDGENNDLFAAHVEVAPANPIEWLRSRFFHSETPVDHEQLISNLLSRELMALSEVRAGGGPAGVRFLARTWNYGECDIAFDSGRVSVSNLARPAAVPVFISCEYGRGVPPWAAEEFRTLHERISNAAKGDVTLLPPDFSMGSALESRHGSERIVRPVTPAEQLTLARRFGYVLPPKDGVTVEAAQVYLNELSFTLVYRAERYDILQCPQDQRCLDLPASWFSNRRTVGRYRVADVLDQGTKAKCRWYEDGDVFLLVTNPPDRFDVLDELVLSFAHPPSDAP